MYFDNILQSFKCALLLRSEYILNHFKPMLTSDLPMWTVYAARAVAFCYF